MACTDNTIHIQHVEKYGRDFGRPDRNPVKNVSFPAFIAKVFLLKSKAYGYYRVRYILLNEHRGYYYYARE